MMASASSSSSSLLLHSTRKTPISSLSIQSVNLSAVRCFSTTNSNSAKPRRNKNQNDPLSLRNMPSFGYDDIPSVGHQVLRDQAQILKYYRLSELELPKLRDFIQPFTPPPPSHLVRLRTLHYQGEPHPATRKSVLTLSVSDLFSSGVFQSPIEKKRFLLLSGVRWDPFSRLEFKIKNEKKRAELGWYEKESRESSMESNQHVIKDEWNEKEILERGRGSIKISCERFPNREQNSKWCGDRLMELIKEAKNPSSETDFASLPLDPRPHFARQEKRNSFARTSGLGKKDFPKEWL